MKDVLDHLPALVKLYGKWPSYLYLCFATACPALILALVLWAR